MRLHPHPHREAAESLCAHVRHGQPSNASRHTFPTSVCLVPPGSSAGPSWACTSQVTCGWCRVGKFPQGSPNGNQQSCPGSWAGCRPLAPRSQLCFPCTPSALGAAGLPNRAATPPAYPSGPAPGRPRRRLEGDRISPGASAVPLGRLCHSEATAGGLRYGEDSCLVSGTDFLLLSLWTWETGGHPAATHLPSTLPFGINLFVNKAFPLEGFRMESAICLLSGLVVTREG